AVWGARFLLAGIVGGGLFSPGFLVGGAGGLAAWAAMAGFARWGRFGTPGISVAGAVAHHLGQLGAAAVLTATPEVLFLLPALVGLGAPVGFLTGTAVDLLLRRLSSVLGGGGGAAAAKSRRPDLVLTGAVLVLALVLALARPTPEAATAVEVTLAGRVLTRLDLTENGEFPVETAEGHLIVQVRAGAVRVLEADCPDQICVLTGWVRSPGGMIVCAPYRVVVRITGSPALGQPDVILR
ncbi:MAG TPA: Gx transporter family protein, partial [Symbiobacteriaceae bacterium]|nr:Gx transporter family protein [Symbiobacteriaceae bacterium]